MRRHVRGARGGPSRHEVVHPPRGLLLQQRPGLVGAHQARVQGDVRLCHGGVAGVRFGRKRQDDVPRDVRVHAVANQRAHRLLQRHSAQRPTVDAGIHDHQVQHAAHVPCLRCHAQTHISPRVGAMYACMYRAPGSSTIHRSLMHSAPCCASPSLSCAALQCTRSHSSCHENPTSPPAPGVAPSHASVYGRVRSTARRTDSGGATSRSSRWPVAGHAAVTLTPGAAPPASSTAPSAANERTDRACHTRACHTLPCNVTGAVPRRPDQRAYL